MTSNQFQLRTKHVYVFLILIIGIISLYIIKDFITSVIMASLLTYLTFPIYKKLYSKIKSKPVSSFIMVLALFLIIIIPSTIFISMLLNEVTSIIRTENFMGLTEASEKLEAITGQDIKLREAITVGLGQIREKVALSAPNYISKISSIGLNFFITLFTMFYFFIDGERLVKYISTFLPTAGSHSTIVLDNIKRTTKAVLIGQLLTAIIQGAVGGIGLFIFGVPKVIFWTFVMIILSIIPFVGAFLVWLPAGLYLIYANQTFQGIGLIIYGVLIVSNIDNFLRPKLISASSNVHPIAVLLGVLGGISVFGLPGLILGPLILSLFATLLECYRQL
jgi:predicted PurR-regulated permease PerM